MSEQPEADDELRPEHWVLQLEKVVAVLIMLAMLKLGELFLGSWNLERVLQCALFVCCVGLLFSRRVAYIGVVILLGRYVGMLAAAIVSAFVQHGAEAIVYCIFLCVLLSLPLMLLTYFSNRLLQQKYNCSPQLNRIAIAAGLLTGIVMLILNPPF